MRFFWALVLSTVRQMQWSFALQQRRATMITTDFKSVRHELFFAHCTRDFRINIFYIDIGQMLIVVDFIQVSYGSVRFGC